MRREFSVGFPQKGNVSVGAVLSIVSAIIAIAASVYFWQKYSAEESADGEVEALLSDYLFIPKADMTEREFQEWEGLMECEAWKQWGPFSRDKNILVSGDLIVREDGNTKAFYESTNGGTVVLSKMEERFEWWRGEIAGDKVKMRGWYTEGNNVVKDFIMEGTYADGMIVVRGERGPRTCTLTANAPGAFE